MSAQQSLDAARTAALAGGLRDRFALRSGDRVAIVMRNRPEYLETMFGCFKAGLVPVRKAARSATFRSIRRRPFATS